MPDDLRTRIAAVLSREIPHIGVAADAVADAVIREMGWKLENRNSSHYWGGKLVTDIAHRYVTDWTADE